MDYLLLAAAALLFRQGGGARTPPAIPAEPSTERDTDAPRPASPTPPPLPFKFRLWAPGAPSIKLPSVPLDWIGNAWKRLPLPGAKLPSVPIDWIGNAWKTNRLDPTDLIDAPSIKLPSVPLDWIGNAWKRLPLPGAKLPTLPGLKASPLDIIAGISGFVKGVSAGKFYDYSEWARQHPTLAATKEFAELGAMALSGPAAPAAYVIGRVARGFADFYGGKRERYWAEMGFVVPGTFATRYKPPTDKNGHRTAAGRWEVYYNFRDAEVVWSKGLGTTTITESFEKLLIRTGMAPLSFFGAEAEFKDSLPPALAEKIGDAVNLIIWGNGGISFFDPAGYAVFVNGSEMDRYYNPDTVEAAVPNPFD